MRNSFQEFIFNKTDEELQNMVKFNEKPQPEIVKAALEELNLRIKIKKNVYLLSNISDLEIVTIIKQTNILPYNTYNLIVNEALKRRLIDTETFNQKLKDEKAVKSIQLTELPTISKKLFSKINISLGWSLNWRKFIFIIPFSFIVYKLQPREVGVDTVITMSFLIINLFLMNWIGKIVIKKYYKITTEDFIGWSILWRYLFFGLLPVIIFQSLFLFVASDAVENIDYPMVFIVFVIYIEVLFSLYLQWITGWALHRLFQIIPYEKWYRVN